MHLESALHLFRPASKGKGDKGKGPDTTYDIDWDLPEVQYVFHKGYKHGLDYGEDRGYHFGWQSGYTKGKDEVYQGELVREHSRA